MSAIRFETFERATLWGRRFYFRIVSAGNFEILAQSEGYTRAAPRDRAIALIRGGAGGAQIVKGRRR